MHDNFRDRLNGCAFFFRKQCEQVSRTSGSPVFKHLSGSYFTEILLWWKAHISIIQKSSDWDPQLPWRPLHGHALLPFETDGGFSFIFFSP
jgi:hypothetical protein